MTSIAEIPAQLAREFAQLGQRSPRDAVPPIATFAAGPWEAYALVGTLQATSRHPGLSGSQRELVLGFAHTVADQLIAAVRATLGPESAIETTTLMGFDPQFDVDREGRQVGAAERERALSGFLEVLEDDDDDDFVEGDRGLDESYVLGERRCRYVDPAVLRLSEREAELELMKCAACNRFFLEDAPLHLLQDLGERVVLGMDVCEACAPKVVAQMRGGR